MNINLSDFRMDFNELSARFRENSHVVLLTAATVFLLVAAAALVIFFIFIRGAEQVMVPSVTGKDLSVAMIEMQEKELYPRIQLKYSDRLDDKGTILSQSPAPGSIVKAGKRIELTVSRGIVIDKMENYVGQNIDDVKMNLQALFTSMEKPLIAIGDPPLYRYSPEPAGTILEQDPLPDTAISGPTKVTVVVSRGPEYDRVTVPAITGLSIPEMLARLSDSDVVYDFSTRYPEREEKAGTVVSQTPAESMAVPSFSRVSAVIAVPVNAPDGLVYGVFRETLPEYPYPFQIQISAISPMGDRYQLASFRHPGGELSVPYAVEDGTVLVLTILNKEVGTYEIHPEQQTDTADGEE